ncbi:OsmC family protein [Lysinibacillus pakistanensis]|uniref:OsmC family protein n=1 Tax=Lysinibacillus pakistanensis TaxID=759811 RepID=A0AAX3WP28_9BACI|nr:OsmC family protein [Lysinibacillus pakistanensis]MDM5233918.1 OsmC family protein [Lysinibacillus pakistanensis]WHY44528.1 OsmC family protein [Lysinibacillus pakistanensis]WHY49536.1 OsmC family protein [Lysinibacillus pakistanensis]
MAVTTFKASTYLKDKVLVEANVRGHKIIIDEPKELGGDDQGANPVELVLSALGACQSIVARIYANKLKIDLRNFWVELEGDLDIDGFLGKSDVRPGFLTIRYTFHMETSAPEEKVEEFKKIIEAHCPVGDTIANTVNLVSSGIVIENTIA